MAGNPYMNPQTSSPFTVAAEPFFGPSGPFAGIPDILGYRRRPSGFEALHRAMARLGYPGGVGFGYHAAAAGPSAVMAPPYQTAATGWFPGISEAATQEQLNALLAQLLLTQSGGFDPSAIAQPAAVYPAAVPVTTP